MNRVVGILGAVALLAAASTGAGQHAHARCFSIEGGIAIRGQERRQTICPSEIGSLLKAPMRDALEWPKYKQEGWITNCSEYLSLVGYGSYWTSRNEIAREMPYMRTCGLLVGLNGASHGHDSFAKPADALDEAVLPPTIAFSAVTADQAEELDRLAAEDISAADLVAEKQWPREEGISIKLIAVADVDGDGTNDYIVERSWSCIGQCSDSSYHVGYLAPSEGHKTMKWYPSLESR